MKVNTAAKLLILLAALTFTVHQIYSAVYKPITTDTAVYYESVDGLNITGTIIRNEYYITCDTGGVYHYLISDGSRVAAGGVIANIYSSEDASVTMSEIDALNVQIADITELQGYNNQQAADIKLVQGRVGTALNELIYSCSAGDYSDGQYTQENLLSAINRKQIATGEQTDFSARLSELNAELGRLQTLLPAAKGSVRSTASGYFTSSVDGYENALTEKNLENITPDYLKNLEPAQIPANVIGKVVTDYEWYIAAKVTLNDSMKYKVGDNLTIRTAIKSSPELAVTVKMINISEASDSAVVIFSCNSMNSELASMRSGTMTIVNKIYKGLKAAKTALRVVDSQTGVYVLSGITINFVPVNVLYSNDDYIICEQQTGNTVLRLYDRVVSKGRKLYDGKVVG